MRDKPQRENPQVSRAVPNYIPTVNLLLATPTTPTHDTTKWYPKHPKPLGRQHPHRPNRLDTPVRPGPPHPQGAQQMLVDAAAAAVAKEALAKTSKANAAPPTDATPDARRTRAKKA